MLLNCETSLVVVICMSEFKLQSVNIDLFLDLFIFMQEKSCSQMYVDPISDKSLAAKFFPIVTKVWLQSFLCVEMLLLANSHKTPAEELT